MTRHRRDHDVRTGADGNADGDREHADPLRPLLHKPAALPGNDTHVHSAFIVDARDNAVFTVSDREQGSRYRVKRAASCLLLPEPGDKVLVSGDAAGGLYIIAVLEQGSPGRSSLHVDGELALSADALSLKANRRIALETDAFNVKARSGAIDTTDWSVKSYCYALTSGELHVAARASKYTGDQRESYYQSVSETSGRSTRYVAGTDTVKAVNLDYAADFIARLSGDTTLVNGETLVKADGKQILVG